MKVFIPYWFKSYIFLFDSFLKKIYSLFMHFRHLSFKKAFCLFVNNLTFTSVFLLNCFNFLLIYFFIFLSFIEKNYF